MRCDRWGVVELGAGLGSITEGLLTQLGGGGGGSGDDAAAAAAAARVLAVEIDGGAAALLSKVWRRCDEGVVCALLSRDGAMASARRVRGARRFAARRERGRRILLLMHSSRGLSARRVRSSPLRHSERARPSLSFIHRIHDHAGSRIEKRFPTLDVAITDLLEVRDVMHVM